MSAFTFSAVVAVGPAEQQSLQKTRCHEVSRCSTTVKEQGGRTAADKEAHPFLLPSLARNNLAGVFIANLAMLLLLEESRAVVYLSAFLVRAELEASFLACHFTGPHVRFVRQIVFDTASPVAVPPLRPFTPSTRCKPINQTSNSEDTFLRMPPSPPSFKRIQML